MAGNDDDGFDADMLCGCGLWWCYRFDDDDNLLDDKNDDEGKNVANDDDEAKMMRLWWQKFICRKSET